MASSVAEFMPPGSAQFGMLASASKQFSRVFRSAAEQSKKYRDDTRFFVKLRDFIVDDLMTRSRYMKEV